MTRYEYPTINVDAENEHFDISDSLISWMENCKSCRDENPKDSLSNILPQPASRLHQASAPGVAWSLVGIFSQKQGLTGDLVELSKAASVNELLSDEEILSNNLDHHVQLITKKIPSALSFPFEPENINQPDNQSTTGEYANQTGGAVGASGAGDDLESNSSNVRMRGNDEWAPPRAQIIFNVHEETNFRKLMQRQIYRCAGCGTKIDLELARRLVLYCHYLGKYFCKCCFSHKAIHLPGYILQKWDFHKYPVSHFALQLLDRIANEPLFNISDINPGLYRKVKKLKNLIDIRMQLYYLKIYISTCPQTDKLNSEYTTFSQQHLLQDDVHLYSLNNLIEVQHGKLYEYLNDLVTRSIAHIAQCDRCRAKGHYCQLCGPSSLMSSMILSGGQQQQQATTGTDNQQPRLKQSSSVGQSLSHNDGRDGRHVEHHSRSSSGNYSNFSSTTTTVVAGSNNNIIVISQQPINDHELIFPFEIGRVAQCRACGCCFHLQCFLDAGQNCPKCERIQRRRAEGPLDSTTSSVDSQQSPLAAQTK